VPPAASRIKRPLNAPKRVFLAVFRGFECFAFAEFSAIFQQCRKFPKDLEKKSGAKSGANFMGHY
jgi:hypothetical protein